MKKHIITLILIMIAFCSFAQNKDSNIILVRHDKTTLKAEECEWVIKSLIKNRPELASEKGKSIPEVILQAIEDGKLKAFDSWTNKPIPAKEIYTWQMPIDTMSLPISDDGIMKYKIEQKSRSGDDIRQIRIYQDWYFDVKKQKLFSIIKSIEFLESNPLRRYNEESDVIPFCRIYY
ncbi:hypothetical protein [Flavobacterium gawalongense]|uniref:Uncharacterized protein n=1 Tax=Flavobacterium gawalongense TaxID=2594432 RepID=A0ABY3CPX3_9FLAO|nr:hypothetical protein [Flavobacterium gawalongense]TRX03230.1 hypothetical protein FNW33_05210 [Flavobacterium gawalongense]TRX09892.1 hypothetical protein FNW12_01900 [Flavobacterium gawalongense]